ncbi:hypothetical protein HWV62_1052, partial [Athelia sp. TMB]
MSQVTQHHSQSTGIDATHTCNGTETLKHAPIKSAIPTIIIEDWCGPEPTAGVRPLELKLRHTYPAYADDHLAPPHYPFLNAKVERTHEKRIRKKEQRD